MIKFWLGTRIGDILPKFLFSKRTARKSRAEAAKGRERKFAIALPLMEEQKEIEKWAPEGIWGRAARGRNENSREFCSCGRWHKWGHAQTYVETSRMNSSPNRSLISRAEKKAHRGLKNKIRESFALSIYYKIDEK